MSSTNTGVKVDVTAGAVAVLLPAAAGVAGEIFTVKHAAGTIATNSITVTSSGGTIDGGASIIMLQTLSTTRVSSDGTNWLVI
jgi:glutaminase